MINILNVGVGLAGSKFTKELSKRSITDNKKFDNEIFINISTDELQIFNQLNSPTENKIQVGILGNGAGKNRNLAIETFADKFNFIDFTDKVKEKVKENNIDLILISFSTGGGTGSGIGPMLTQLLFEGIENNPKDIGREVIVMGVGLLPEFTEGICVFRNTLLSINDINKGISSGGRYMLIRNPGKEGSSFVEKREFINELSAKLIVDYLKGTKKISRNGVLDLNDRRMGLSYPGLHAIARLKECDIMNTYFITPNSSLCKHMLCEIPEENADMYEANLISSSINMDYKFGYTTGETGLVAYHGFNNILKETLAYRKRFDDLKKLDSSGNEDTGVNSLNSLKSDVYYFDDRKDNTKKDSGKSETVNKKSDLSNLVNSFKKFESV